jgi:hypothetical protein
MQHLLAHRYLKVPLPDGAGATPVTSADGQNALSVQLEQCGLRGVQTCCPKPTMFNPTAAQLWRGIHCSNSFRAASGVQPSGTHRNRCVTRVTCVSTTKPASSFPKYTVAINLAIFGPTPGNRSNSETLRGTPRFVACNRAATPLMFFALVGWKLHDRT